MLRLGSTVAALLWTLCGCAGTARPVADVVPDTLVSAAGLSASVHIVTDGGGIPHIRASSLDDLYFAWGYVTARERLWQIAHNRAAARGERWRWMGNDVLRSDGAAQLLEFGRHAAALWERERDDPAVGPPIERYTAGINAWIERCERGEAAWPVEFDRLRARPERWRPQDSALLLWSLGVLLDLDLAELRERDEVTRFGREGALARRRFEGRQVHTTIPDSAARRMWGNHERIAHAHEAPGTVPASVAGPLVDAALALRDLREAFGRRDAEAKASNVFAVGPGRSANRAPLLANDLHLGLTAPSPLMLIHVSVPGVVDAAGAFPPGLPAIVSGRNRECAWGITSLAGDMLDVYADSISADGRSIRGPDGAWHEVREAPYAMRYRVLGVPLPPFGQKRRYGPHGPILLWDDKARLAYGIRWTALTDTLTMSRLIGVERSLSAAELEERWSALVTPGINLVAADATGDVRYRSLGAIPNRATDPGRGPLPGDGRHEWLGVIPREHMPAWHVPRDGFVVNANNLPIGEPYPYVLPRYDWANDRAIRMAELLSPGHGWAPRGMMDVQNDLFSRRAQRFLPALMACVDSLPDSLDVRMRAALDTLRAWDLRAIRESTAPTLFWSWYGAFHARYPEADLRGLLLAALQGEVPEVLRRDESAPPERAAFGAVQALRAALDSLTVRLGPDPASWRYAQAHLARFSHPLARDGRHADLMPERTPIDGDGGTPSVGRSRLPESFEVTHAPVLRHVVDLAHPDSSWVIIVPGNSGDARSPHARDHLERWADHAYVVLQMNWERVEPGGGLSETRLVPVARDGLPRTGEP